MAKVIQPPVLLSRVLTFVFATSVVVLATLFITLVKIMPLERPEVFFLSTHTLSVNATIEPLVPNSANQQALEQYEKGFVREKAYDTVQPIAMKALETKTHYKELLKQDPVVSSMLTNEEIDSCFTLDYYLVNVDYIFNRLNIK